MADIFLSYSREDRSVAESLAAILPKHGWTLYWDRHLLAGEVFDDVLEREITAAKCVLVLWSGKSIASQWVRNEADEGATRKAMVSVRIEDVRVPLAFRRIQAADLVGWRGDPSDQRLAEVFRAISALLKNETNPAPALSEVPSPHALAPSSAQKAIGLAAPPSEQWLADLKRDLARYVGPVAQVMINRALRESATLQQVVEKLSGEIPNDAERRQFLKSHKL